MPSVDYPSLADAEVIQAELLGPRGEARSRRFLVDSGFTGTSSLVLPTEDAELVRAEIPASEATGALRGRQERGWVSCCIPELGFQRSMIAILTDTSALSLPADVDGLAGLKFLRHFGGWGARREQDGQWRFFLSTDT